jgi:hypothetical protein
MWNLIKLQEFQLDVKPILNFTMYLIFVVKTLLEIKGSFSSKISVLDLTEENTSPIFVAMT